MKAIYLEEIKKFKEVEIPLKTCGPNQVVVQIKAVGVCGSDVHYWKNGRIGQFIVKEPLILGHECSGIILDVGSKVTKFQIGDRVVLEPGIPCMECDHCKKGRYNLCQNIVFFATPPDDGVLAEYLTYDENYVYKIPEEIDDFGLATMAEPMSVGVFATQRINPCLGERAIIFGAGIIGITCLLAAKAAGCNHITVADIRQDRLEWAKSLGADEVINTRQQDIIENSFDFAYEATGSEMCYQLAVRCLKPGARIGMIGMGTELQQIPMVDYVCKEITIIPSFRYSNTYPVALELVARNSKELQRLITHRMPFTIEGVESAFETASESPSAMKVIVEFQ